MGSRVSQCLGQPGRKEQTENVVEIVEEELEIRPAEGEGVGVPGEWRGIAVTCL